MKQIFKKTNRFLAAFLAVAMVLTMLPISRATAWALDDVEITENTDGGDTGTEKLADTRETEDISSDEDTAPDPTGDEEPGEGEAETPDPMKSYDDVTVWLSAETIVNATDGTTSALGKNYTIYLDGTSSGTIKDKSGKITLSANKFSTTGAVLSAIETGQPNDTYVAPGAADLKNDSKNGFSFYVKADAGYAWPSDATSWLTKVWYGDFSNTEKATADAAADYFPAAITGTYKVDATASGITAETMEWDTSVRRFTISSDILKDVITKSQCSDTTAKWANPVLVIQLGTFDEDDLASATIPAFTYVNNDEKADSKILSTARTVKYASIATGAAAESISGLKASVTGSSFTADMITATWTPTGGTAVTFAGSSDEIKNPDITTGNTSGTIQWTDDRLKIAQNLVNAFVLGEGTLTISIDTTEDSTGIYDVSKVINTTYATITKDSTGTELPATINTGGAYSFYVKPVQNEYGQRSISNISIVTDTEQVSVFKGTEAAAGVTVSGNVTTGLTVTLAKDEAALAKVNDNITISVSTTEELKTELTGIALYNAEGGVLSGSDLSSGQALQFSARATTGGDKVKSVKYYLGKNPSNPITLTASNGVYTTPAVTDTLTILAESEAASLKDNVLIVPAETRIYSYFKGNKNQFKTYWEATYGGEHSLEDLQVNNVADGTNIVAVTFQMGEDVLGKEVKFGLIPNEGNINDNGVIGNAEPPVGREGNARGEYLATIFTTEDVYEGEGAMGANSSDSEDSVKGGYILAGKEVNTTNFKEFSWTETLTFTGETITTGTRPSPQYEVSDFYEGTLGTVGDGEEYFFTVSPADGYEVDTVKYAFAKDAASITSWTAATPTGAANGYKTAAVTNNVFISVTMSSSVSVIAPANGKVSVDFADDPGESVTVPTANDFYFTVAGANSNVTVTKVDFLTGSGDSWASGTTGNGLTKLGDGRYKIGADALKAAARDSKSVKIVVTSTELMTTGFTAKFAVAGEDSSTEHPTLIGTTSQRMELTYGEVSGALSAVFTATNKAKTNLGTADYGKTSVGTLTNPADDAIVAGSYNASDTVEGSNIVQINGADANATVTGHKIGTDTITAQVTKNDFDGYTDNTQIFRATLPVTVSAAYENIGLVVTRGAWSTTASPISAIHTMLESTTGAVYDGMAVGTITVVGTNTRTGETVAIGDTGSSSIVDIGKWSFDPDNTNLSPKTAKMRAYATGAFSFAGAGTTVDVEGYAGKTAIQVGADLAQTLKVTVPIQQAGETEATNYTANVTVIDAARYLDYPKLEIVNGKTAIGETAVTAAGAIALEADTSAIAVNGATLTLELYKAQSSTVPTDINTATNFNTAKSAGTVTKVSPVWSYTVTNPTTADSTKYVEVADQGDGVYKISAKKAVAGNITLKITASMDSVMVFDKSYTLTVTDSFKKAPVYLKLDNALVTEKNSSDADVPVQQVLTGSYYTNTARAKSIVESTDQKTLDPITNRGVIFTKESVGSSFILPTQADFDSSKIGTGYVLVGWQNGTTTTDYYAPGDKVTVTGTALTDTYTAIWRSEYEWPSADAWATNDNEKGNGLSIYNGNTAVTEDSVTSYSVFSTMTNLSTASPKGSAAVGGSVPVILKVKKIAALPAPTVAGTAYSLSDETAIVAKIGTDQYITSGITLTSADTDAEETMTLSGNTITPITAKTGATVRATWTFATGRTLKTVPVIFDIEARPTYTMTVENASVKVDQIDSIAKPGSETAKQMTATLKKGDVDAIATDYTWNWSSSDETVAEVTKSAAAGNKADIIAKKAGTTTITAVAKDASGLETTATGTLTVTASGATVSIRDPENNEASKIEAYVTSNGADTGYTVSVSSGVNLITSGTSYTTGDGAVVAGAGSQITAANKIEIKTGTETELSDEGELYIYYTYGGENFRKVVPVETYYLVTLNTGTSNKLTKDGEVVYQADGTTPKTSTTIKVPFSSRKSTTEDDATTYTYENVSLGGYAAVYAANTKAKTFKGWSPDAIPNTASKVYTTSITDALTDASTGGGNALTTGNYELTAYYEDSAIAGITTDDIITLANDHTNKLATGSINLKDVTIGVEPALTEQTIWIVPDKVNFYQVDVDGSVAGESALATIPGPVQITKVAAIGDTTKTRTDVYEVAAITDADNTNPTNRRAGVANFTLKAGSATGSTLQTVTVYINGYDKEDTCYWLNGATLKDAIQTISGATTHTWYFGADGKRVTGTVIETRADNTKILIKNGEVASKGKTSAILDGETASKTYVVGDDGKILTGWLTETFTEATGPSNGMYYVDRETGDMLSNALYKDATSGKTYYFQAGGKLAKASATANEYEEAGSYYVNAAGEVAVTGTYKVNGIERLFTEEGKIITYADTVTAGTPGKYTVNSVVYVIDPTTNEAEPDHTEHTWSPASGFVWAADYQSATLTFTCQEGGETKDVNADVTHETKGEGAEAITRHIAKVTADPDGKAITAIEETKYIKADGTESDKKAWNKVAGGGEEGLDNGNQQGTTNEVTMEEAGSYTGFKDDAWKANQVEAALNIYDKDATVNVYFTGTVADPETVEIQGAATSYYEIRETRTGGGYTSVAIGINTSVLTDSSKLADAKKNNKLTFVLGNSKFAEGDNTATMKPFTLKVSDKLPTYTLTTKKADIYTGSGSVVTTEKNGLFDNSDLTITYVTEKGKTTTNENITAVQDGNAVTVTAAEGFTEEKKGCLLVTDSSWVDGAGVWVGFPVAQKTTKNLKLVLTKKTMTLNTKADNLGQQTGMTALTLTGGAIPSGTIEYKIYEGKNELTTNLPLEVSIDADYNVEVQATTNASTKGSYKVEFTETGDTKQTDGKAVVLTVKTTDRASALTASLKGKLDAVAQDTAVYVIPKLTNFDGAYTLAFASDADANQGLKLEQRDGAWAFVKDTSYMQAYKKGNIEVSIKAVDSAGNDIVTIKNKLKVPVVVGKFTASGTMVNLDALNVNESAQSNIEGIYTYSIYDAKGKASKAFITFTGECVALSNFKEKKDTIGLKASGTSEGVVEVTRLSKFANGKKNTVQLSVQPKIFVGGAYIAVPDIKAVTAKIQVKAKVK